MKLKIVLLLLLSISFSSFGQDNADLDSSLCRIYQKDQAIRQQLNTTFATGCHDSILAISKQMQIVDKENQAIVFDLLDTQGWPEGLSETANLAIFLVIDHAKPDSQEKYYPIVKQQEDKKNIDPGLVATLQDRIRMHKTQKQIYGTQTASVRDEQGNTIHYLWPIENPDQVDEQRKSVNLPPLAEYIQLFQKQGMTLIWDKTLSPEELSSRMWGKKKK